MNAGSAKKALKRHGDKRRASFLKRYFKTGPGEYAEGDIFIGVNMPALRMLAKEYQCISLPDAVLLLKSPIHEERMLALLILVFKYSRSDEKGREEIYGIYLKNTKHINNWDLVDLSAKHIVGAYLADKDRKQLYVLAGSGSVWDRRIAVLATFYFIARRDFKDSLNIAEMLLNDRHGLIHKAAGWMLREIGKKDMGSEEVFLERHASSMPRTMLRYAIERFPEKKRLAYLRS